MAKQTKIDKIVDGILGISDDSKTKDNAVLSEHVVCEDCKSKEFNILKVMNKLHFVCSVCGKRQPMFVFHVRDGRTKKSE